eukprot:CAMPEP_0182427780 /NCGR_PEP_ID=MMETSP1167-20130531/19521_1 /TAXON_ID=2988 /ORGANISM="Mallomonas Sp, Strain CCMP3275" /LENGTH=247 /DNA_ID=CAMNT_0024610255 /DNA_START=69 /DNA_END=812 /DNA_ORIENTATION=+
MKTDQESEDCCDNDVSLYRSGKWSDEEEAYAVKLIDAFRNGCVYPCMSDKRLSLRSFLSKKLQCNRMRISKKFAHIRGLGLPYSCRGVVNDEQFRACEMELKELESKFLAKEVLRMKRRERMKRKTEASNPAGLVAKSVPYSDSSDSEPCPAQDYERIEVEFDVEEFMYTEWGMSLRMSVVEDSKELKQPRSYPPSLVIDGHPYSIPASELNYGTFIDIPPLLPLPLDGLTIYSGKYAHKDLHIYDE